MEISQSGQSTTTSRKMSLDFILNQDCRPTSSFNSLPSIIIQDSNDVSYRAPISTLTSTSESSLRSREERLSTESSSLLARRQLARQISIPSPKKGFIICKLCNQELWGPNGRYHVQNCSVISSARDIAKQRNATLKSVAGITIHRDTFKKGRRPSPKPAKIAGFVMSHNVSLGNPRMGLTREEIEDGVPHGRKGYVRCLKCNSEIFAPNAKHHASICHL